MPAETAPETRAEPPASPAPGGARARAEPTTPLAERIAGIEAAIRSLGSAVVALSGGVDSATLAVLAWRALGKRSLAITGISPSLSEHQRGLVRRVIERRPLPHEWLETDEMDSQAYQENGPDRCFFCKHELYGRLRDLADARGFEAVLDGTNADDCGDVRPGRRAAQIFGVRSPLLEAGLGKAEVRGLARELEVPVAEEPASACLASRVPELIRINARILGRVEAGEAALRELGFSVFRVRHHGDLARIELPAGEIPRALEPALGRRLAARLNKVGYARVAVDLRGYRPAGLSRAPAAERDLVFLLGAGVGLPRGADSLPGSG